MNATQVTASTSKDRTAISLTAKFSKAGGGSTPTAGGYCGAVVKSSGSNPSYAMVGIPTTGTAGGAGNWDKTTGVALKSSVAKDIKLLSRASCGYSENGTSVTLLNGWVISHGHNIKEDSIVTQVFDDRHIMASYYTCFGKMCYDPSRSLHYFVSNPNDPQVFNKWGHGDCIDSPNGPRFAPGHRYGHLGTNDSDATDEPSPGSATASTRKWTIKDILTYQRDFFYEIARRPNLGQDFGLLQLPVQYLEWPKELGNNIVENKTPQDFSLQGCNLLEALCKTLSYAGPYELNLEPINDVKSKLEVIDFSKRMNSGVRIFGPDYFTTLDEIANNPNVVEDGHIKQSALGYVDNVANMGDSPCIEFMASTDPSDTDCFAETLLEGWTAAEEAMFKARVSQGFEGGDAEFFGFATREFPSVYAWYRLNPEKNPFGLSKHADKTESGNYVIRPHQLTSYNQNADSPLGLVPREFVIEYKMADELYQNYLQTVKPVVPTGPDDLGPWRVADRLSSLQLSPCGKYIQIPGLRDKIGGSGSQNPGCTVIAINRNVARVGDVYSPVVPTSHYNGLELQSQHIRIQVVAQSDHAIVSKRGSDTDVNNTAQHIDPSAPKFSLLITNTPMQYVDHLRRNQSYPCGIGGLDTTLKVRQALLFQPKQDQDNELWTDHIGDGDITNRKNRLDNHTQKFVDNHKRIMWEGHFQIARMTPVYKVGQIITYEASNGLPGVTGVIKCIVITSGDQKTKLEIGPPSFSTIWDGPMQQYLNTGSGGAVLTNTDGGGDQYDKPYEPTKTTTTQTPATTKDDYDYGATSTSTPSKAVSAQQEAPKMSKAENRRANQKQDYDYKLSQGDYKGAKRVERMMRQEGEKQANAAQLAKDKAFQRANKGTMNGKEFNIGEGLIGKNTSGTMNGKSDITDAFMGKASSGSINGKTDLNAVAAGMTDTRKANKADNDQYRARRVAENARMKAQNDRAAAAMGPDFNRSGKGPARASRPAQASQAAQNDAPRSAGVDVSSILDKKAGPRATKIEQPEDE